MQHIPTGETQREFHIARLIESRMYYILGETGISTDKKNKIWAREKV